jgi:hypothetical protein
MPTPTTHTLTKSLFVAGWQCPKLLWKTVHQPGHERLQPTTVERDLFDQGRLVGELMSPRPAPQLRVGLSLS